MSAYLSLVSNAPGAVPLTLISGPPYSPWVLVGTHDLGNPSWTHQFSAPRGTQGRRASGGTPDDRQVTFGLLSQDHVSKDDLQADLAALAAVVDEMRRFGGTITHREHNQTRKQRFDVIVAGITIGDWGGTEFELRDAVRPAITATCSPYVLWDPYDVLDTFDTDNVNAGDANYTADNGALTNVSVSGGQLNASLNLTTPNLLIYTGNGYTYGDTEATVRFAPGATIASFAAGVALKRIDASNFLLVYIDDNGVNSRLRIDKVVAGATTNLVSTNLGARLINGRWAWCRGRIEGNVVYAEHFIDTDVPTPILTPTTSTSYTLSTAEAAIFGTAIEGKAGLLFTPQAAGAYVEEFEILPFTYRNPPTAVLDCYGAIPGDAPALGAARVAPASNTLGKWGMVAWAPRANVLNLCQHGSFEESLIGVGWSVAAVAGVTGAATSINLVTDTTVGTAARYGERMGQVVTPATANTGASIPLYRRFRKGITYTATAWVRSNAGTTLTRIRLGVNGDIASSTAVALSTTWTQHTATWTPTADVDLAYFAVEVTAATATTFQVDAVAVYAGTVAPTFGRQVEGVGSGSALHVERVENVGAEVGALVRTADADANGGFSMADSSVLAAGETYGVAAYISPAAIGSDDYTRGSVDVEVWMRVKLSSAFTGGVTAIVSLLSSGSEVIAYSSEYGAAGKSLVMPTVAVSIWRMARLGSLSIPSIDNATRWKVGVTATVAAGTNLREFAIDELFFVPSRSRFLGATGKASFGYPDFAVNSVYPSYRLVNSDLSSSVRNVTGGGPAGGISGSLIELAPGQISLLGLTSSHIPDSPDASAIAETQSFPSLHLAVTPRSHWLRGA